MYPHGVLWFYWFCFPALKKRVCFAFAKIIHNFLEFALTEHGSCVMLFLYFSPFFVDLVMPTRVSWENWVTRKAHNSNSQTSSLPPEVEHSRMNSLWKINIEPFHMNFQFSTPIASFYYSSTLEKKFLLSKQKKKGFSLISALVEIVFFFALCIFLYFSVSVSLLA